MKELEKGKKGKPLKALEVLSHANELLTLGETLTSLRKLKPMLPPTPAVTEDSKGVFLETQKNYGFDPKAWKLLGIDIEKLAGNAPAAKKSTRKKSTRKKK